MRFVKVIRAAALAAVTVAMASSGAFAMSAGELRAMLERGEKVAVVDVRGASAYAEAHIPGALNVPMEVLKEKRLPPLGRVVVCGDSLDTAATDRATSILNAKAGIKAEPLAGGFETWAALGHPDTRAAGLAEERSRRVDARELARLDRSNADLVTVDLRRAERGMPPKSDLAARFPQSQKVKAEEAGSARRGGGDDSFASLVDLGRNQGKLLVLVDDGDGRSEELARRLKAAGVGRVVILAGGELGLEE